MTFHVRLRKDKVDKYVDIGPSMDLFFVTKHELKLQVPKNVIILENDRTKKILPEGTYKDWIGHIAPGDILRPQIKPFTIGKQNFFPQNIFKFD